MFSTKQTNNKKQKQKGFACSQTRSGENSFSAQTRSGHWLACFSDKVWEKIVLALRPGIGPGIGFGLVMGIGFACSQTRSGKYSFSVQTWSGHWLCMFLRQGLGKNSFSAQTWSRYWLWTCHGHWLCMFSDKVWKK